MNKLIKGAITGAAGVALLLGGAGTFAAWNSQASIAAGPVNTGSLSIGLASSPNATWKDVTSGTTLTAAQAASYLFAPGDTLTLTENVTITAAGNNLLAQLSAVAPTLTDTATGQGAGQAANVFTVSTAFNTTASAITATNGATITAGTSPNTYSVSTGTSGTGTITLPVTVTISLPASAANSTENAAVNLTSIGIDLTQTGPATASPSPAPAS